MIRARKPVLRLLTPGPVDIFTQLRMEEALLRGTKDSWLILSRGQEPATIVLGMTGKAPELVHLEAAVADQVPAVRRFTGGGTVVIDQDTLFTSLIMNADDVPSAPLWPREVMQWSTGLFANALRRAAPGLPELYLGEHDYCVGEHKVGGNAQALTGRRWVHHTSWLWRYQPERMAWLQVPKKQPAYRAQRDHGSFLTTLDGLQVSPQQFYAGVRAAAEDLFDLRITPWHVAEAMVAQSNTRIGTVQVDLAAELK